uniref:serine C-palmitoyltransferase n=1 Tax=Corethron hystrix TaxID=216773 RepID=A0A7S1BVM8_9STRA|mmetsp:Transcript_42817/g.100530  ORF Transcript_42817/g.100530 Transcript_42817/m.100530 type:complete len:587 (+) Transcript_42817:265-2025(+)
MIFPTKRVGFNNEKDCDGDDVSSVSSSCSVSAQHVHASQEDDQDPYSDVRSRMAELVRLDRLDFGCPVCPPPSLEEKAAVDNGLICRIPDMTFFTALTTYFGYAVVVLFGHIRDFFGITLKLKTSRYLQSEPPEGYAPLLNSWEHFYTKRIYHRIQDCFNRPISSTPGAKIEVLERVSPDGNKTMEVLGPVPISSPYEDGPFFGTSDGNAAVRRCTNLGSYNYLGFADAWLETCGHSVLSCLESHPITYASPFSEAGRSSLHLELEGIVADFLGKEDAMLCNMGFSTNSTVIPALVGPGDLILSDEFNHTSIVNGARASGATIRIFRHNCAAHLEEVLRDAILNGRNLGKILVIVEGIYSMEGEYADLNSIVPICRQYGAFIYLDEAHSIGASGASGRGCCEHCGIDTSQVDVFMGTFTKSFGAMGGYIAGNQEVVDHLRNISAASRCLSSMSPVVCQQIITAFKIIMGKDGTTIGSTKMQSLKDNSNYFRMRLNEMGLHVLGNYDSPIMPVMLYNNTKIAAFSRECFHRGLAIVVVGFPAVAVTKSRARFCISAAHSREDLDRALLEIDEVADLLKLKYAKSTFG